MQPRQRAAFVAAVVVLVALLSVVIVYGRGGVSRPVRYELPANYQGWVFIEYGVPTCPPSRRSLLRRP